MDVLEPSDYGPVASEPLVQRDFIETAKLNKNGKDLYFITPSARGIDFMWPLGTLPDVMSNYHHQAAAVAAQGFGPPASPHTGGPGNPRAAAFPPATSPGPGAPSTMDMYSSNPADYVQAASPQPSAFPAIAVSRAPINYNPVGAFDSGRFYQWVPLNNARGFYYYINGITQNL
ncbi:hypothetical protein QTP88_002382 [Uroleucon formosanum]